MARKYRLQAPSSQAPWAAGMAAAYGDGLGSDNLGQLALTLLTSSKDEKTYKTYGSALKHFFNFCREEGLAPLEVTVLHIVRYIAYLGQLGTIAAANFQPYLSAINRYMQDHQREPVALGPLVVDAVAGVAGLQQPLQEPSKRAPLPASVAKAIHDQAELLATGGDASLTDPRDLADFRDCLATVVSYIWFNRSDTTHSLRTDDLTIDGPLSGDRHIRLLPRQRKGKKRDALSTVRTVNIPVSAHPQLAAQLLLYKSLRREAWNKVLTEGQEPPYQLWALPGDTPSRWTSAVQNSWLASALRQVQLAPP